MNIFLDFLQHFILVCTNICTILNSKHLCIILQVTSLTILARIIINLLHNLFENSEFIKKQSLFLFFSIPIFAIMTENMATIAIYTLPKSIIKVPLVCFSWIMSCFKFHSLLLFLEKLINKHLIIRTIHKLFFFIEIILAIFFIIDYTNLVWYGAQIALSNYFKFATLGFWIVSIIPSIITIIHSLSSKEIPQILKQQLQILLAYLITPYIICIFLEFSPVIYFGQFTGNNHIIAFSNLSLLFILYAFYFCYRRIMQFRFLNLSAHVQAHPNFKITANFKDTIEQLNLASNKQELEYITQNFFHEQFQIPKKLVSVYVRSKINQQDETQQIIETFINNEKLSFNPLQILTSHKIFLRHEIEFDAFNSDNSIVITIEQFLQNINCDIFIPIENNQKIIGYVTVKREKKQKIYNLEQQNKMIVFAQFLAPAMFILSQKNLYALMKETKEIKEELYAKHQEVNQYKESIKKLLKDRIENHIGIIFYKNKHFSFRNQEAQQLIGINPNLQHTHPTSATLTNLAQQVERFKSTQTMCITIQNGQKLIVSAMPYTEPSGGVILTVRHPEPTDIIKSQVDALKDPSKRDYLLYLETTQAGKLINKLIPSNNEPLLQIKIQLLEAALQKNALLLQSHENDLNDIATIIHQISLKEPLHIINLQGMQSQECAIKLFGINPLLQEQNTDTALLEKINQGTLFIKNIELLDAITQQKLAYFIRYGIFTPLKSEQRKFSDIRIICSTQQSLSELLQNKLLAPELYQELQKCSLSLPSLLSLAQEDLCDLIDGYMYQALQDDKKKCIIPLTFKEKNLLLEKGIESLCEFKKKIHTLMIAKSQEQQVKEETLLTKKHSFNSSCSELELATQLGKHALKDKKLMQALWEKLGSQSKIAELLGVNRSSVNRRCKDYNIV